MRRCKGWYMTYNAKSHTYNRTNFEFGFFHQFGCNFQEFETGIGNYTTAIIELTDGRIIETSVDNIQFLDKRS